MKIGITIRNMGSQSSGGLIKACALVCDANPDIESVWITDHIAIPPDDAQGSAGRYLDTLTTLAWLAGFTDRVKLGSGVLILPYRPALPVAKQIATLQELSAERLLLGVGIGWMDAEFRALGIDRRQRGQISDEQLAFLRESFANEVVARNGQSFLFKPRPQQPPILVGGRAPHAVARAVKFSAGWMPMAKHAGQIAAEVAPYRRQMQERYQCQGDVSVMTGVGFDDLTAAKERLAQFRDLGIDRLICSMSYDDVETFEQNLERLQFVLTG